MPIYCVAMSDVKQESLANNKLRISTQQQCMYEGPAKKSTANQRKEHVTLI